MFYRICAGFITIAMLSAGTTGAENYEYDKLNRVTKVIYEDGSYVTYEYDANGNITHTEVYDASNEESDDDTGSDDPTTIHPGENDSAENDPGADDPGANAPSGSDPDGTDSDTDGDKSLFGKIIDTVVKVITSVVNWVKSLFKRG